MAWWFSQAAPIACRLRPDATDKPTHHGGDRHRQTPSNQDSYSRAQNRRASCTGSSDTKRHKSEEGACHHRPGPSGIRDQQKRDYRQECSGREAQRRIDRRLDGTSLDGGHAELVTGMGAEGIRGRESIGDFECQINRKPTFDIDRGQFLLLALRMRLELSALLVEVGSLNISLRADRYVFAAIAIAPATSAAIAAVSTKLVDAPAAITPIATLATETIPSLAPRTAARSHPARCPL